MAEVVNETYLKYLAALNFRAADFVCISTGGGSARWENYFRKFESISGPSAIQRLTELNESGSSIYLSMAPFIAGANERKKELVAGSRHVWVDIDKNGEATLGRITDEVNAHILPDPAIVVQSSPSKYQIVWRIDPADFDVAKQELLNRALQVRYETDEAVTDTARVLRVAGFKNNKYPARPLAQIVYTGPEGSYKFADFKIDMPVAVQKTSPTIDGDKIPHGQHDKELTRIAGRLRHDGIEEDSIATMLIEVCEKRCENYGSDYREMCEKIAHSIARKPAGKDDTVLVNGKVAGSEAPAQAAPSVALVQQDPAIPEIEATGLTPRPVFPAFVMYGTTLYENLVKPAVELSSKYPELIFMPAVQLMLNAMYGRVRIKDQVVSLNMFLGSISPYGKFFKSSSCELAQEYFTLMGLAASNNSSMSKLSAEGKIIISQAGSTEGFGRTMAELNGKHALLYNEELSKMVSKASIESASYAHDLLSWYGSAQWGNPVLSKKNSFSFPAKSYCFSWCFCTTDRGFNRQWPLIAGMASGMEDRLFFLLSPKEPCPSTPYNNPPLAELSVHTRAVYEKAVQQGVYAYEDCLKANQLLSGMDPRSMQLVQALALYFAVDLNEDVITEDCVERALELVKYRNDVRVYLQPIEAADIERRVQKEILRELRQNSGKMKYRDLCRNLDYCGVGLSRWQPWVLAMIKANVIVQWDQKTAKGRTVHMVGIPKQEEEE